MKALRKPRSSFGTDPRVAAVVQSIGDVYYVLDRQFRVVMMNAAAEAFFGWPREQAHGRCIWDLVPGGQTTAFGDLVARAIDHGEQGRITAPSYLRPGRIVDFRVAPLGDEGVGVSFIDVTERTLAEQAMRDSRERLDLAVGAHNIGIFDWHVPSGSIVWSRELEAIFGLDPGSFEGTAEAFQRRVLPEDFARAQAATDAALAAGHDLIPFNFRMVRADGAIRWIEGVSRIVYAGDGAPERIVGTNFDVTERVLAEQALRESRDRLDLAVGAHSIGIFDWDLRSGRVVWSHELEAIFGLAPGTFESDIEAFRRRVIPEDLASLQAATEAATTAKQEVLQIAFRIRRADGAVRWLEGVNRIVYGPDGEAERMVGTNIDVTERKTAEEHQRLLVNELNHRVKNTLAIVQAIAWQSFRAGGMSRASRETFEGRIAALAAAHDVLTSQNWEASSIGQMVEGAVAPHDPGDGRLTIGGPRVKLEPKTAVAVALAIHELATNAVKHGALSTPTGRVDVNWRVDEGRLNLCWRETGGPQVTAPVQLGFGARLLERGLAEELQGVVRLQFLPDGVQCLVEAPLAA